jgi:hypothetical protein
MYDRKFINIAAVIVVVLFTSPFWLSTGGYVRPPLELPANASECIEPVEFMRAQHMTLLNEWRDQALRNEKRIYVASDGRRWEISLQNTCMQCHSNSEKFCDTCHVSNSVRIDCWKCHIRPEANGANNER